MTVADLPLLVASLTLAIACIVSMAYMFHKGPQR